MMTKLDGAERAFAQRLVDYRVRTGGVDSPAWMIDAPIVRVDLSEDGEGDE